MGNHVLQLVTRSCTKRSNVRNKKAKALWSFKEAKRQRSRFPRSGQCAEDSSKEAQARLDLWAIHLRS